MTATKKERRPASPYRNPEQSKDIYLNLIQAKVNLYVDLYGNRTAILHGRLEPPPVNRLNRLLIESHSQRPTDPDVARLAIASHHQPQHNRSLVLGLAGFFRVFGVGRFQCSRC